MPLFQEAYDHATGVFWNCKLKQATSVALRYMRRILRVLGDAGGAIDVSMDGASRQVPDYSRSAADRGGPHRRCRGRPLPDFLRPERFLDMTEGIIADENHPIPAKTPVLDDFAGNSWID